MEMGHVGQFVLLVDVNHDASLDRFEQPRALHLARLEYNVAVAQQRRRPPPFDMRDGVERVGVKPVGKRIIDQKPRNGQQPQIMRIFDAVTLQRPEVIGIPQLPAQFLEQLPVMFRASRRRLPAPGASANRPPPGRC